MIDLDKVIEDLPIYNRSSAVSIKPQKLSKAASLALGQDKRRNISLASVILDTITDKLFVEEYTGIPDDTWLKGWGLFEKDLYRFISRDGITFVLVQWDNDKPKYNIVESYDGVKGAAVLDDNSTINIYRKNDYTYADIYYADRVEQYRKDKEWNQINTIEWMYNNEGLGLALIPFGSGTSDIAPILQSQDDYNVARLDQLVVSRLQGFPKEYIKSDKKLDTVTSPFGQSVVNSQGLPITTAIERSPGSILPLPKDAEYNQLDAAEIDTTLLDTFIQEISLISGIPTYYFKPYEEPPSGRSLIIQTERFKAKIERRIEEIKPSVITLFEMFVKLSNAFNDTNYAVTITVDFAVFDIDDAEYRNELFTSRANVVNTLRTANVISTEDSIKFLVTGSFTAKVSDEDNQTIQEMVARINAENVTVNI